MSIKSLFNNKTTLVESANSGSADVESKDFILSSVIRDETFYPFIDFATASNFAKFGSAEEYYKNSIERIHNEYPYDGSKKEKIEFELSSSYLDKYILDQRYPKTNGYINFTGPAGGGSKTEGYGTNSSPQYIYMRGGIHVADDMSTKPLYKTFDKSVTYDSSKKRVSSLKLDMSNGITTEFWLKKAQFDNSQTEKEVILDLWNSELSSSSNYGRFTLALSGTADGENTFIITIQSGTVGFYEQSIGTSTVTTSSMSDWHHYAFSFISASSGITSRIYVDGDLNQKKSLGSSGINEIQGLINGYIGALQTAPSGNVFHGVNLTAAGTLSASLDDFRFWKTRRTSKEIYNNWYQHVGGGTNTDDSNINLGVYYKFNEGIVGNNTTDSVILDYSGRLVNGTWTGYVSGMRTTSSAFIESGLFTSEPKDPIIYSSHPDVASLKLELKTSGSLHDRENQGMLYNKVPQWIRDEDEKTNYSTKKLYQIISSYFDTLHIQIESLPYLKNKTYPESNYKPLPFADRLLEEKGLIVSNLFSDASILEAFGDRDINKITYEKKLTDVKNQIYTNIYNNLENIYKHKGTEGSIRNLLRCFGIDDEIVKLNVYTDQGKHYFSDSYKHTSVNKKYINFYKEDNLNASIFQTSSVNHSLTYISGSGASKLEQYNALSSEISIILPKKLSFFDSQYFSDKFLSSSIFGMHEPVSTASDYSWNSSDLANFQVYVVKDELGSSNAKFLLKDYNNNISLESPVFKEIYSNEQWNLSVRIKPEDYPFAGNVVTSSNRNYTLEFYGVTHAFDNIKNEFLLTQSLNYTTGSSYLSNAKRFYIGAHRTNFTGSVLEQTDIKVGRFNLWYDYVGNDEVKQHNKDITSKGNKRTTRASTIFGKDLEQYEIPTYELLVADWDFELVSNSDSSGEFITVDASSGSNDTRYGWMDNIIRREHRAKGIGFPISTSVATNEIIYSSKKELPEISYSSDGVTIKGEQEEYFIEDEDVSDNFYALEKSMYQTVSEEMLRTLSTAQEMSNLMGEAVERYRLEYKKLNHVRRMFFEDVEQDLDFDRFTEYFKWIDSSVSYMVSQMFPMSVRFSKGISDVVESHIFERNKYQNKFPLLTTHTATEGRAQGVGLSKYRWEFGHAPLSENNNDNCLWQKERSERSDISERETIRKIITNRNNAQSTTVADQSRNSYTNSTYGIRNFSKPVDIQSSISQTLHGGTNYNLQKDRNYLWSAVNRHSQLNSVGTPVNVMIVGAGQGQGIELPKECNDIEAPNQKKKFNSTVFIGKESAGAAGGAFSPINDSASYSFALKGHQMFPFNFVSGNIATGYNSSIASGYKSDAVLVNLHSDTTDFSNDVPMQGPFTQQWVGGHQSRHVDLNRYNESLIDGETLSSPPNNIQNKYTRPEAWRLVVVEAGGSSDGALGLVDPEYGITAITGHPNSGSYPDVAKKSATLFRDLRTKRPVNISNIQTTTSSINHGNFTKNYEIISAVGKHTNNSFFRKNSETHNFLPDTIADILPKTTNYQTLVGVSNHLSGNVFGIGESNVLNSTVETFSAGTASRIVFDVDPATSISDGAFLQITGASTQTLIETSTNDTIDANSHIIVESLRRAFRATSTSSGIALDTTYSGLSDEDFSVTFWFNNADSNQVNSAGINFNGGSGGSVTLVQIGLDDDINIRYRNGNNSANDVANFNTNLQSVLGGQWVHVHITLERANLAADGPRVWINGSEVSSTGFSPIGGASGDVEKIYIYLDDNCGFQDIVVWNQAITGSGAINELYNLGSWRSPELHTSASTIVDWYKMGDEEYWYNGGVKLGEDLTAFNTVVKYISSSFGTGNNDLRINTSYDEDITMTTGKGFRTNTEMWNRLSSSLEARYPTFSFNYADTGPSATFTMTANSVGPTDVSASESGSDFTNLAATIGTSPVIEKGYINTTSKVTGSVQKSIISTRFSAPGSIDTLSYGFLDAYSQEYSVYNNLNYRNLSVRGIAVRSYVFPSGGREGEFYTVGGSGEENTIRADIHRSERDSLKTLLARHCDKFGFDNKFVAKSIFRGNSTIVDVKWLDDYSITDVSYHKQQRNENRRPSDTSTVLAPNLIVRHDNLYINSPIPRSDFQYKWVTSSLGSNYNITSGKQRMYGYAHPTGILSSSVTIDGDSGFVPAITFPTASEIFGE